MAALEAFLLISALAFHSPPLLAGSPAASQSSGSWLAEQACRINSSRPPVDAADTICPGLNALLARARQNVAGTSSPEETVERLNGFFFDAEGFQPTFELDSPDHLLLDRVLVTKKGHCVGLATVYLVLAEELGLPIHAVATPKHVFLRWDDGKVRRNIELFRKGREAPDEEYVREQKIPPESIERGVFLTNLTPKEFLGFIYQNRGVLKSQSGDFEASGKDYRQALHLNGKLAAAYYNRGNDELKQKRFKRAIRDYTKALKLYPTDAWALKNRGLAWKGLGEIEKAEEDLNRAESLGLAPGGPGG